MRAALGNTVRGLAVGLLLASGCSPAVPTGTVVGTVTLDGRPLPEGYRVAFISERCPPATSRIEPDGTYRLAAQGSDRIALGHYRVWISQARRHRSIAEEVEMMKSRTPGKVRPRTMAENIVPGRFRTADTSGLSVTVVEGPNRFDIAMESK